MTAQPKKLCPSCNLRLPLDAFYNDRQKKGGKAYTCKNCVTNRILDSLREAGEDGYWAEPGSERWRKHYEKLAEEIERKDAERRAIEAAARRQINREKRQKYVEKDPEKVKAYAREYMKKYRESKREEAKSKAREHAKKYYMANRERILLRRKEAYEKKAVADLLG